MSIMVNIDHRCNSRRQKHLVILLGVSRGPEPTEFEMCVTDSGNYRSSVPAFAVVASARSPVGESLSCR